MDKLKVAVIGTGIMGKNHVRVYSLLKNVDLVAICDSNKEVAKSIAERYDINYYTDYKKMMEKENLDAISVCVPTKLHKDICVGVMKKRINVLVEKPIATTVDEANEMVKESEKNKVKLMVGHIERFNPVVIELKKMIKRNELGKIYNVHCARMGPTVQRIMDTGVIIDLAIHEIDILMHLINSKIKRLYAETAQKIHSSHEDLLIGTIRFENDVLGVINSNWLTPKIVREIAVAGENGMLFANYFNQDLFFHKNDFVKKELHHKFYTMMVREGTTIKIKIKNQEPLINELNAFSDCILKNKQAPVTGQDGSKALFIAQKFLESAKRSEVINL